MITGNATNTWKLFFVRSGDDPRDSVILHEETVESENDDVPPSDFLIRTAERKVEADIQDHATLVRMARIFR